MKINKDREESISRREASFPGFSHGGALLLSPSARRVGTATMVAGTVTVADPQMNAGSIILITAQETGALAGVIRVSARVNGTSFTISSSNAADTAVMAYLIFEP